MMRGSGGGGEKEGTTVNATGMEQAKWTAS